MLDKLTDEQLRLIWIVVHNTLKDADESLDTTRQLRDAQSTIGAQWVLNGGKINALFDVADTTFGSMGYYQRS